MYPYVLRNSSLHYLDDYAILLCEIGNYVLNDVEVYMIEKFNGNKSIDEITNEISIEIETNNKNRIKDIIMEFINNKTDFIFLSNTPNPTPLKKLGLKNAKIPISISLSLTNKCNLKCIHCFKKCSSKCNDFVPYDKLIDTLNFLKNKTKSIQITGGEPMLHNKFFDILKYCIKNFATTITTTGTLINSTNAKNFKGINTVQLSVYSYKEHEHDSFTTVPGSFKRTLNAIKELSKRKIYSTIATIVTKKNINDIENMIKFASETGTNSIRFGTLTPCGRGTLLKPLVTSKKENKNIELKLDKLSKKYKDKIQVETWHEDKNTTKLNPKYKCLGCGAGILNWCISETGTIKPCEFLDDDVGCIGNINETKIEDLVKNYNFEKLPESFIAFEKRLNKQNTSVKQMCEQIKNYYLKYCTNE